MYEQMKQVDKLFEYFERKYVAKHKSRPKYNKVRDKWDMKDMLDSLGATGCKEVIDYYFTLDRRHDLRWLMYNFDKLQQVYELRKQDRADVARIKEETKRRAKERNELGS